MQTAMTPIDEADQEKPWYAHIWPWLLMLGPVLVIIAGGYTSWLAFSRQDAMVVDDYYKQGKAINQDLRRDRVATSLGLSLQARYDPVKGTLQGRLQSFGAPAAGNISLYLAHSTQPEKDLRLEVQLDPRGEFSVALPMLDRARWQLTVEGARRDWRLLGVWQWPQQQSVDIKADLPPAG
ncbi:MAG: cytochrome oxidase assembly protein [Herminiimonas sp.]|nr:cytochrome oxidase assembly protein [Herminiimonas sp.]MDB5855529.1 cytochrome oxidase assembly protein [Herminiimonas sp.]